MGWRNASFRGYADYMQTPKFLEALETLMVEGWQHHVAGMCAEAVPWRCHWTLISDALVIHGWTVRHIISAGSVNTHTLTPFVKPEDGCLTYPSDCASVSTLPLF